MQSRKLIFLLIIAGMLMVGGWTVVAARLKYSGTRTPKPYIAASIYPLYDIVRNIAGPDKSVALLTPPGIDPATYTLSPEDLDKIRGVKFIFVIGHGLDDRVAEAAAGKGIQVVMVDRNIDLIPQAGPTPATSFNPHYWLSVKNAGKIAATVADTLSRDDPGNTGYQARAQAYVGQLEALYREGQVLRFDSPVATVAAGRQWQYFATEYNLALTGADSSLSAFLDPFGGSIDKDTYVNLMRSNFNSVFNFQP